MITLEQHLDAISRLEALIEVHRSRGEYDQALIYVARVLKLLGAFPAELDLSDDDPLWAVSTPAVTHDRN